MKDIRSLVPAVICAFISASMVVSSKLLIDNIPTTTIVFIRLLIGSLCFMPFIHIKRFSNLKKSDVVILLLGGIIGMFVARLLYYQGLSTSTAFNASLINALTPALTLMAMCIYLKKSPTGMQLLSFSLALCGVLLIITNGNFNILSLFRADGNLLILISVCCSIVYTLAAAHKSVALSTSAFGFGTFIISLFLLTPFALKAGLQASLYAITMHQWLLIIYLSLTGSGLGYYLFIHSAKRIGPETTAYIMYSIAPMLVMIFSFTFFNDPIMPWELIGSICIMISLLLHVKSK